METFIVIDGNSLINRAFYALPPLNGKDGKPTQAVYGFVTMLIKLMDYKPGFMAVAFDLKAPTFRHKEYELYKANRKGMPDDLAVQMPILKNLLREMGIAVVEKEGYEADDIIGTMAKRYNGPTYIVTGDRDSFQLIDETTKVLMTKRGITETGEFDRLELKAQYGLTPEGIIVYKALAGDSSDNIPGVPGIGVKTATDLVNKYETLDNLYASIGSIGGKVRDKLIAGKDSAYMSLRLATIDTAVPELPTAESCKITYPFGENVKAMFDELNFKSLLKRDEIFGGEALSSIKQLPECENVTLEHFKKLLALAPDATPFICEKSGMYIAIDGAGYRLPLKETLIDEGADEAEAAEAIKQFMEGDKLKVVFDAKTLKKRLAVFGLSLNNFFDVELCQYLINSAAPHESLIRLGVEYNLSGGLPLVLGELYKILKEELKKAGMEDLYFKLELPLIDVLFDMERTGFKVDRNMLDELNLRYGGEICVLQDEIIALAGHSFNINSPKQLATVLFDELKIPYPKRSKSYSTSAEILEPLKDNFPIVAKVLDYRFLTKLKNTYLDGLKVMLDRDDLVHTEFKQMLTTTGRLSSVEPNLQNIPIRTEEGRNLRKLFVPREGNVLVSADYSQIELRLMAHFSQDKIMVEAYKKGEDIHASTAAEIYGVPLSEVTSDMRREAKVVNFGIIYGMSDFGLSQSLGISPRQASAYIQKYFERFSGVKQYLDRIVELARENGYVETLYGRRRYIPELKSSNYMQRMFGERVAMNTPLQGSAADIIKAAMIDVSERLKGMKSKLILQIHDELIIDAAMEEEEAVKQILVDCMENVTALNVPLKVEVGCGKRWFDCK
ncbi:MAG: DNA polymerase I [Clostridiales bacterium]|nr:DNA polymerase I [Clostridiales bacterium]